MARVLSVMAECPYCSGKLPKAPTRNHPCPSCKKVFHIQRGDDGNMYAVTKDELSGAVSKTPPAKVCPACQQPVLDGDVYCHRCGSKQGQAPKPLCQACGLNINDEMTYCPRCGVKLIRS